MATAPRTATAPAPQTALAIKPALDALEQVARSVNLQSIAQLENRFEQAAVLADGIVQLRTLLGSEVMGKVMRLQGSPLGFRVDDKGPYSEAVVKEAFIEATLRGLQPVGNQWNIIASRCYVTKEGFTYLMAKHPGLTDIRIDLGVPVMRDGGAVVHGKCSWKLHGQADALEADIPIRVNSGMGADAILGKAERKLRARVYNRITGTVFSDGDVDDDARVAAARNVTPVAQQRITTAALTDEQQREADFAAEAAEEAARLTRTAGED